MNGYPPDENVIEALAAIHSGDWEKGISLFAEKHKRIAQKEVMNTDPNDAAAISRAQAAFHIWETDVPNIIEWSEAFSKEQNANQRQGAK